MDLVRLCDEVGCIRQATARVIISHTTYTVCCDHAKIIERKMGPVVLNEQNNKL